MRVLFVLTKRSGGVGRYVNEISDFMVKKGVETEVIYRDEVVKGGFIESFYKLRKMVSDKKYDFLVSNDWSIALPLIGMRNHFSVFHGYSPKIPGKVLQKIAYFFLKDKLIVVGDFLKSKFPKARLIYEGVNLSVFKPKKRKRGGVVRIGFVQDTKDETYRFSIIKNALKKTDFELVIAKNIPHKEMPGFYNSLDVFISLPDFRSGFNLCWLEAMACKVATIGNNNGIGKRLPIIKIEEPPTEEKIIDSIKLALKNRVNYRSWIKENCLTWEKSAEEIMGFLEGQKMFQK